jgi:hypothetical protein
MKNYIFTPLKIFKTDNKNVISQSFFFQLHTVGSRIKNNLYILIYIIYITTINHKIIICYIIYRYTRLLDYSASNMHSGVHWESTKFWNSLLDFSLLDLKTSSFSSSTGINRNDISL